MTEKECPLCISPLGKDECEFYPCPCGYQICSFCFNKIQEEGNRCPKCRRPFDQDAGRRVGPQFRPSRTESTATTTTVNYYLAPKIVKIQGIPEAYLSPERLTDNSFLGQYGKIKKICVNVASSVPSAKVYSFTHGPVVYVKYRTPEEANSCVHALDGFVIGKFPITASLAIVENCTRATGPRRCPRTGCLKRHRQPRPTDIQINLEELTSEKVKQLSKPPRPENYRFYPKRSGGVTVFPAPRMIPTNGTDCPFMITKCYSAKPLSLSDLVGGHDILPLAPQPKMPLQQTTTSLSVMFSMETRG